MIIASKDLAGLGLFVELAKTWGYKLLSLLAID
jgi:hypothetical protein